MSKKKMSVGKKVVKGRRQKAAAPATDRIPRKEPYNSSQLKSLVERLREQSMRLSGLARGVEDAKVGSVVVDGHAMLIRGLNQIDNFADNCARAVREAKAAKSRG